MLLLFNGNKATTRIKIVTTLYSING